MADSVEAVVKVAVLVQAEVASAVAEAAADSATEIEAKATVKDAADSVVVVVASVAERTTTAGLMAEANENLSAKDAAEALAQAETANQEDSEAETSQPKEAMVANDASATSPKKKSKPRPSSSTRSKPALTSPNKPKYPFKHPELVTLSSNPFSPSKTLSCPSSCWRMWSEANTKYQRLFKNTPYPSF